MQDKKAKIQEQIKEKLILEDKIKEIESKHQNEGETLKKQLKEQTLDFEEKLKELASQHLNELDA